MGLGDAGSEIGPCSAQPIVEQQASPRARVQDTHLESGLSLVQGREAGASGPYSLVKARECLSGARGLDGQTDEIRSSNSNPTAAVSWEGDDLNNRMVPEKLEVGRPVLLDGVSGQQRTQVTVPQQASQQLEGDRELEVLMAGGEQRVTGQVEPFSNFISFINQREPAGCRAGVLEFGGCSRYGSSSGRDISVDKAHVSKVRGRLSAESKKDYRVYRRKQLAA